MTGVTRRAPRSMSFVNVVFMGVNWFVFVVSVIRSSRIEIGSERVLRWGHLGRAATIFFTDLRILSALLSVPLRTVTVLHAASAHAVAGTGCLETIDFIRNKVIMHFRRMTSYWTLVQATAGTVFPQPWEPSRRCSRARFTDTLRARPRTTHLQQLADRHEFAITGCAYFKGSELTAPSLPPDNVSNEAGADILPTSPRSMSREVGRSSTLFSFPRRSRQWGSFRRAARALRFGLCRSGVS